MSEPHEHAHEHAPTGKQHQPRLAIKRAPTAAIWRAQTPAGEITVTRNARGNWNVVYAGFSRSANPSLAAALAEATGTNHQTPWILQLARTIEAERAPD
jgi:hypothetical protein